MYCNKTDCVRCGKQNCKLKIVETGRTVKLECEIDNSVSLPISKEIADKIITTLQTLEVSRLILQKEFNNGNFLPAEHVRLAIHLMEEK